MRAIVDIASGEVGRLTPMFRERLIIVGNPEPVHVGAHLGEAAKEIGLQIRLLDSTAAYAAPRLLAKLNWLRGRIPTRLHQFSKDVVDACREFRPETILSTGIAPLSPECLRVIGSLGIRRLNFLTDDPWNRAHLAPWFFQALPHYDHLFSPREANLDDLRRVGVPSVSCLRFAYAPGVHYHEPPGNEQEAARYCSDVVFAGGADADRLPLLEAIGRAGFRMALYGGYWDRNRATRPFAKGHADPPTLRKAVAAAKVALCLVRRANRDGHCMRSFELAAMGACILAEDTEEHRSIYGEQGAAYFRNVDEMLSELRRLVENEDERSRLAANVRRLVATGANTYADRLKQMLRTAPEMVP